MRKVSFTIFLLVLFTSICSYSQTPFRGNLTAGINNPLGDFSNLYKGGVSIEAGLFYSLPLIGIDLTLTAGYNGYKYKNDYFTGLVSTNLGATVSGFNVSWTATDIPVMVGARYKLPVGNIRPYISGEVGLHLVSFADRFNGQRLIGNSSNPTTFQLNGATESGSEIGIGTAIGGGIEIPLVPKVNLDLNVKYNYAGITYSKSYNVFRNSGSQFTTVELKNLNYVTIRGGVVIDF
jgi:opacity protein-like surface antigen